MKVFFTDNALKDYKWFAENDNRIALRITRLITSIKHDPFSGIDKPEPLKYKYTGFWSRRIDKNNRLVYQIVDDKKIMIVRCKGHYED